MSADRDPRNRRPFIQYNSTGIEKRRLLRQGSHLPTVGQSQHLDGLPRHYIELLESKAGRPWKVTLWIKQTADSNGFDPFTVFARGADPLKAIPFAERFWRECVRDREGILPSQRFPDALGKGHATKLDEGDWAEYYKDATKFGARDGLQMFLKGEPKHPYMFCVPGLVFDIEHSQTPDSFDWDTLNTIKPLDPG